MVMMKAVWPLVSPHCSTLVTAGPQSLIRWSWKGRDFFYDEDDESDVTTCVSTLSTACFNRSEKKFLYTLVAFNTVFMKSWGCLKSCWIMQYRFSAASVGRLWQILWIWKSVSAWRWQENLATSKFTCCCCSEQQQQEEEQEKGRRGQGGTKLPSLVGSLLLLLLLLLLWLQANQKTPLI